MIERSRERVAQIPIEETKRSAGTHVDGMSIGAEMIGTETFDSVLRSDIYKCWKFQTRPTGSSPTVGWLRPTRSPENTWILRFFEALSMMILEFHHTRPLTQKFRHVLFYPFIALSTGRNTS